MDNKQETQIVNNGFPIYLTGLLFAIATQINWLICAFSFLMAISVLVKLNKKLNFISFKKSSKR